MKIINHSSVNFRNLKDVYIEPYEKMNIIFGENGQGKTNLIESIWMMTGFYSFRTRKNIQLINYDSPEAVIKTNFFSNGREQEARLVINQTKELTLNGVREASPRAMIGSFYSVVFSPVTLGTVQNGPSERRKLLDVALSLMKPNYAVIMSKYIRVLDQRNSLLKKTGQKGFDSGYFEPWDAELVRLGSKIIRYRTDYIARLSEEASDIYGEISSGKEKFACRYDFDTENLSDDEISEKLKNELEKSRDSDLKRLYTGSGPHTHDLILTLNDRDAKIYGSQGQQRTCALSLKLAEAVMTEKVTGEAPVVLLDDVMSELDEKRQTFILRFLDNKQVFITCCEPSTLLRSKDGKVFEATDGIIKEIN